MISFQTVTTIDDEGLTRCIETRLTTWTVVTIRIGYTDYVTQKTGGVTYEQSSTGGFLMESYGAFLMKI